MRTEENKTRNMNEMDACALERVHAQLTTAVEAAVQKAESLLDGQSLKAEKEELGWFSFYTHINEEEKAVVAAKGSTLYLSDGREKSTGELTLREAFEALYNLTNALQRKRQNEEARA